MDIEAPRRTSLALLTDLYQLTMAYGYWKSGIAEHRAVFALYFREHPFQGGFTVSCGQQPALEYLEAYRFHEEDPILFREGLRLTLRCGEEIGGQLHNQRVQTWKAPPTTYTTYVWIYEW